MDRLYCADYLDRGRRRSIVLVGYFDHFDSAPGTSDYASNSGSTALLDEIHFIITDEDGEWTGTKGAVLEKFAFLSKASDAKNSNGSSNYYVDVLNNQSQYVWWTDHPSAGADWGTTTTVRQAASNAFPPFIKISLPTEEAIQ